MGLRRQLQRLFDGNDSQLATICSNDPNLRRPDFFVDILLLCQGVNLLSNVVSHARLESRVHWPD
jgi:hypothetical protein